MPSSGSRTWSISEAEVTQALRTVTGLPVAGPAAIAKEQKILIGHPKP